MFQANDCPHSGSSKQSSHTPASTSSNAQPATVSAAERLHAFLSLKTLVGQLIKPHRGQQQSVRNKAQSEYAESPPVWGGAIETSHQNPVQALRGFTRTTFPGCGVWNPIQTPKVMVKHAGCAEELNPKSIPGLGVAGFDPANQYSVATLDGIKGQLNIILVGGDPARGLPDAEGKRMVVAITEKVGLVSGSVYLTEDGREVELDNVGRLWATPGQIIYQFRPGKPRETQYSDAFYEQTLDQDGVIIEDKLIGQHFLHTHYVHNSPESWVRSVREPHMEEVLAG